MWPVDVMGAEQLTLSEMFIYFEWPNKPYKKWNIEIYILFQYSAETWGRHVHKESKLRSLYLVAHQCVPASSIDDNLFVH